jgi:S-adenosylmethionine:tRNA ribosyltransferase-isomerase
LQRSDFHYDLPAELIAQYPPAQRTDSRMLCLDGVTGRVQDRRFIDLPDLLQHGDLLVVNDTRVIPARLHGRKSTGGLVELMVDRIIGERRLIGLLGCNRAPRPGQQILFGTGDGEVLAVVEGRRGEMFELSFPHIPSILRLLEESGHVPLPPYIQRADEAADRLRYQTVYAERAGAAAAPTAGLHFDKPMLEEIADRGIQISRITLHVGAGTFQPLREEDVRRHRMHAEWVDVPTATCAAVAATRERGGRVVAVGTTTVRALETAARSGPIAPFEGDTDLFIRPGFRFHCVDAMLTNFHLPGSTLLMLVCAFAGTAATLRAYQHAVDRCYRFYSYGDAMLVSPQT